MTPLPTLADITALVAAHYSMPEADLVSRCQRRSVSHPRQLAAWLAHECTRFSRTEISEHLGGRDPTTISYAVRIVRERMEQDPKLALVGRALKERLKGTTSGNPS